MSGQKEYFNVYPFNLKDFTIADGFDALIESMAFNAIETMRHYNVKVSDRKVVLFSCCTDGMYDRDDKKFDQVVGWCCVNEKVPEIFTMKSGYKEIPWPPILR